MTITLREPVYRALTAQAAQQHRALDELINELLEQVLGAERDESQAWYWTERWQAGARVAEADLQAGRYKDFATMDEFIAALDEPLEDEAVDESAKV
jgi:hypothetical protein